MPSPTQAAARKARAGCSTLTRGHVRRLRPPAAALLFLTAFSAQSALLVLAPVLPQIARDLGVTTATAGQLRSVSGLVAGAVALATAVTVRRRKVRGLLVAGTAMLALGSAASAVAPSFPVLAVAQIPVGVGLGLALTGAIAAAGVWAGEGTAKLLSWALLGQPVAWIVGMPIAGAVGDVSWRAALVVLPLAASLVTLVALARCPEEHAPPSTTTRLRHRPRLPLWAVGELLAFAGWAGTLVYAGALFTESYAASSTLAGVLLAVAAIAYLPGNRLARRRIDQSLRPMLLASGLALAAGIAVFGGMRPSLPWSGGVFALLGFLGGIRTMAASALGLAVAGDDKIGGMGLRTAAQQLGYLGGAGLGGAALAGFGYPGLGVLLGALVALATVLHLAGSTAQRPGPHTVTIPCETTPTVAPHHQADFAASARQQLPSLWAFGRRLVGREAEDLVKDCLRRARAEYHHLPGSHAASWWFRDMLLRSLRERQRWDDGRAVPEAQVGVGEVEQALVVLAQLDENDLWQVLDQVPPRYRAPLVLVQLEGSSVRSVAQTYGVSEATVRSWLHRGQACLQAALLNRYRDITPNEPQQAIAGR